MNMLMGSRRPAMGMHLCGETMLCTSLQTTLLEARRGRVGLSKHRVELRSGLTFHGLHDIQNHLRAVGGVEDKHK